MATVTSHAGGSKQGHCMVGCGPRPLERTPSSWLAAVGYDQTRSVGTQYHTTDTGAGASSTP